MVDPVVTDEVVRRTEEQEHRPQVPPTWAILGLGQVAGPDTTEPGRQAR